MIADPDVAARLKADAEALGWAVGAVDVVTLRQVSNRAVDYWAVHVDHNGQPEIIYLPPNVAGDPDMARAALESESRRIRG